MGLVVPLGRGDPGVEADVASQVVLVGDELGVTQDLGLRGVALGPLPFLLEFGVPAVGVVDRQDVATGTRDSGSSTRFRPRRQRSRGRRCASPPRASGTAGTSRRNLRRRSPRRRRYWCVRSFGVPFPRCPGGQCRAPTDLAPTRTVGTTSTKGALGSPAEPLIVGCGTYGRHGDLSPPGDQRRRAQQAADGAAA